jgi:hypothetical protein
MNKYFPKQADLALLSQELFNDAEKIIQQRFFMNYDANLKQDSVSTRWRQQPRRFSYVRSDPAEWSGQMEAHR